VIFTLFLCVLAANLNAQTYSSEEADIFLVATGTDEGKTSWIVLWDTAPHAYGSNGEQVFFLVFLLTNYLVQQMADPQEIFELKVFPTIS
jgi:hypothetical protein